MSTFQDRVDQVTPLAAADGQYYSTEAQAAVDRAVLLESLVHLVVVARRFLNTVGPHNAAHYVELSLAVIVSEVLLSSVDTPSEKDYLLALRLLDRTSSSAPPLGGIEQFQDEDR